MLTDTRAMPRPNDPISAIPTPDHARLGTIPTQDDKRLDRQLTYQTFHIGLYISLFTAIIGASFLRKPELPTLGLVGQWALVIATACLGFAGMCGAMVASKIPSAANHTVLYAARIGFSLPGSTKTWPRWRTAFWESLEHLFFWIAMALLFMVGTMLITAKPIAMPAPARASASTAPLLRGHLPRKAQPQIRLRTVLL